MHCIRILEIPPCKMVASQAGMFGDGKLEAFDEWLSSQPRGVWPKDFLYSESGALRWAYLWSEGMAVPEEFEIIDWPGGLYAVATDADGNTNKAAMDSAVTDFIGKCGFERDLSRPELGNVITPPSAAEIMGFSQMDYWYPIKQKGLP